VPPFVPPIEQPSIRIQSAVLHQIIEHARRDPLVECCGLVAGRENQITRAYPAKNVAADPATRYEVAPRELVDLTRQIREDGLDVMGIYHSHPNAIEVPSETDVAAAEYPGVAYFIVSHASDRQPQVRAFSIRDGQVSELNLLAV
jgi:[CysO sulfur-carrier protein]-S-L-cysteine hydrolase